MKRSLICGICGTEKVEKRNRLMCPECARRYARTAYARAIPSPATDSVRKAHARNRNKVRPTGLKNQRVYTLKKDFGLSEAEYLALVEKQASVCQICGTTLVEGKRYVDHNHATNTVRGILCRTCNMGLGHFADSSVRLQSAALYIELWDKMAAVNVALEQINIGAAAHIKEMEEMKIRIYNVQEEYEKALTLREKLRNEALG